MNEFNIKLPIKENTFRLVVLGDMHLGDECCDLAEIKSVIEFIKNDPATYCILNGDLINNALKTSKSDTYKETMTIADQQELLIELLYPIKDKILVMATGNHEYRTNLLAGINPLKSVAIALGIKDKLVENSYLLNLEYGIAHGMKNQHNNYTIYGIHGGNGGGRRAGSTANALQEMALIRPDMDLYIHSHTHQPLMYNDMIFLYDKSHNKTKEHQRTFINANSFLKYGGYAEQKGFKPNSRRPYVIVVTSVRNKGEMYTTTGVVTI